MSQTLDLHVERRNQVALVEIRRPPHNYFDIDLITHLADIYEALDRDPECRAIVLAAQGKAFCAGANLPARQSQGDLGRGNDLYRQALRLFRAGKPVVAAIQGAAVGGGLGLALSADFRVTCEAARFSANFTRLGTHPGFGLTVTLPRAVGQQQAELLFLTGRRVGGAEAVRMGLADVLAPNAEVRLAAQQLAHEIAASAPLAVQSTRATLRLGLAHEVAQATERESGEQRRLFASDDFKEGVAAMGQRRVPVFEGR